VQPLFVGRTLGTGAVFACAIAGTRVRMEDSVQRVLRVSTRRRLGRMRAACVP